MTKQISCRVDDDLLGAIERARGDVPRERWIRNALWAALDGADDAIHCRTDQGLLCRANSFGRRAVSLAEYPSKDVGGSYCWECLRVASFRRAQDEPDWRCGCGPNVTQVECPYHGEGI